MDYYNGYTPQERNRKLRESYKKFPNHSHPYYKGKCHMCGDSKSPVEPHSEDYSEPYLWECPAEYALCKPCHGRLHKRFNSPHAWEAYKRHMRRGGYGSDLKKDPHIGREISKLAKSLETGDTSFALSPLSRTRRPSSPDAWWEHLTIDPESLRASWARPRNAESQLQPKFNALNTNQGMNDFRSHLKNTGLLAKALESIQMKPKEKADLGELCMSKHGISVTRDSGNRVRGETIFSCSQIGKHLTAHFGGARPPDLMMWVGFIEPQSDGNEQWMIRPEIRAAIKKLGWF